MIDVQQLLNDCKDRQLRWNGLDLTLCLATDRAAFLRDQTLACIVELTELLDTVGWKPWAAEQGLDKEPKGEQLAEAADILFFLGNIFSAFGFTSLELADALNVKRMIIETRHASATYTG